MTTETNSIWKRHRQIEQDRMKKTRELMEEYDKTVYRPAIIAIQKECSEGSGHRGGKYHDNGFGWSWFYCNQCGARYDITGPDGEKE